ncbi:MAG TPA: MBL fold metallo-hydrolase [Longimicrobiales bacterium]|nr:MBL fold metallo-hydrolase [Longimicrobiales bacterium]
MLRTVLAPNDSPLTLDGTRTYLVGRRRVAILDPGSDHLAHLDAVATAVGDGAVTSVLVTHHHPDHVAGAGALAERFDCPVRSHAGRTLHEGQRIDTDAGDLVALSTPGHTADHVAFHWPAEDAVFCGDLMMGGHDTALVAPPEGRLGPYLASLARIRMLLPKVIYPAHGPAFQNPGQALDRYIRHRELRQHQVLDALGRGVGDYEGLLDAVYGSRLDPALRRPAMAALKAYLQHLQGLGRIRRRGPGWEVKEA